MRLRRYRGFSFAEVMFSVVILGVGFIMVASIFPVAAAQTRSNNDQAIAAQVARSAFQTIQSTTTALECTPDGNPHAYGDGIPLTGPWEKLRSSMICQNDKRYAWIPFYTKPKDGGPIQFTVLVVRRSLHDSYRLTDTDTGAGELMPQNVSIAQITIGDGSSAIAQIEHDSLGAYNRVGPGSYLMVTTGDLAGHVLQVGELAGETSSSTSWKLVPGFGLDPNQTCGTLKAAVVGRDLVNADDPLIAKGVPAQFGGTAQDISVFSTYLDVK